MKNINHLLKKQCKQFEENIISPSPNGNCFLLLFAWGGYRWSADSVWGCNINLGAVSVKKSIQKLILPLKVKKTEHMLSLIAAMDPV